MTAPDCPLCRAPSVPQLRPADRNRRTTDRRFHYCRCQGCGVIFLADRPDDLSRHYTDDYHGSLAASDVAARADSERYKLDLVRPHASGGRLIDVGPSYGGFPYLAREAGYDVAAIEVDPECCAFIADELGIEVHQSGTPEQPLRELAGADVITLWHSIEHVPDPWATLAAAAAALRPGGVLVVATPNPAGLQARVLRSRWPHVDAPRHLFLIAPDVLFARARSLGLEPVDATTTDPGGLDCNFFGWHHGLWGRSTWRPFVMASTVVMQAVRPWERRALRGACYTAVLRRDGAA